MLNGLNIVIYLLLEILSTCEVRASDFHSPRTDALGGAGHASPLLSDAIYLNPSFSSFIKTHALSFNYLVYGGGQINTPLGVSDFYGHNLNISVLDGTPESIFQAGVGYTTRADCSMIHVGASKSFWGRLGVGLGSKFIFPNDNSGNRYVDGTLSVTGLVSGGFQTTFIVDNLFETDANGGFNREFILGTKFNIISILLIYIDPHWVPTLPASQTSDQASQSPWGYEAGVEFPFFNQLFLRLGTFQGATIPYQAQRGNGYGLGLGWLAPRLSFDYSFSRVFGPLSSYSNNFGVSIFF